MFSSFLSLPPADFARSEFGDCSVGDPRRQQRVVSLATAMATYPGLSIPQLFGGNSYPINASYDLFKREEATPDRLQSTHRDRVRQRCSASGLYLLVEDTTDVSYSGGEHREGLGPIGNRRSASYQGVRLHSVIAMRVATEAEAGPRRRPVEICGLLDQQFLVRPEEQPADPNPTYGSRRKRMPSESLESQRWIRSIERTTLSTSEPEVSSANEVRYLRVADREADIYEYLSGTLEAGQGFVVRASQNRRLQDKETGQRVGNLMTKARTQGTVLGSVELDLRARPGMKARTAKLTVSSLKEVLIQSPQRPGQGQGKSPTVPVEVVRVWEATPPQGVKEPLEWLLLTSEPAATLDQALNVVQHYSSRWIIEEFHKALKTILGAERLQLERGERLIAAVSLMSIVALRMIDLREEVRLSPEAPAEGRHFDKIELKILNKQTGKTTESLRDAMRAMAKLGGFIGRKGDGEPGMIILWRGRMRLQELKAGYLLAIEQINEMTSQE